MKPSKNGPPPAATNSTTATANPPAKSPAKPPAANPSARSELKPSVDQLRRRAYEIYLHRVSSGKPGDAVSDWAQAERELKR